MSGLVPTREATKIAYYAHEDHQLKLRTASSRYDCSPVIRCNLAPRAIWSLVTIESIKTILKLVKNTYVLVIVFLP